MFILYSTIQLQLLLLIDLLCKDSNFPQIKDKKDYILNTFDIARFSKDKRKGHSLKRQKIRIAE